MLKLLVASLMFTGSFVQAKPSIKMADKMQRHPASISGTAEVVLLDKGGWVRVDGESARAMYEALSSKAKNNQGEAGESVYFKTGKNYECWMSTTTTPAGYTCVFSIKDSKKGLLL